VAGEEPGFEVVVSAVRSEIGRWDDYEGRVEPVHRAVRNAHLGPTAFFVADPTLIGLANVDAIPHQLAYQDFVSFMESLLAGAVAEFPQIADALNKTATAYENAEKIIELKLNQIYTK
jgi:hypothetical protein